MGNDKHSKIKEKRKRRCKVGRKRTGSLVNKDSALNKIKKSIKHNKTKAKESTKLKTLKKVTLNKEIC